MDIELSARTLREVEFREKLRGYSQEEVDEFLDRAAAGVEVLHDRLRQAMERAMRAEQRVADLPDDDDALRRTLVLAQRTADMAVKESQQQARETIERAQNDAQAMVTEAEERARSIKDEAERDLRAELSRLESARQQLNKDIVTLERHVEEERGRMRAALANAAAWVDQNLSAMAPPPPLSDVEVPPPPPPAPSRGRSEDGFNADAGAEPDPGAADQRPAEQGHAAVVVGRASAPSGGPPAEQQSAAGGGIFDAEQLEGSSEDNPTRIIRVQGPAGRHSPTRVIKGQGSPGGREQV
jgi:cell division initiation protein